MTCSGARELTMCTKAKRYVLLVPFLASLLGVSARAQNVEVNVQTGTAIVCDTQQQMERFVALFHGDEEAALKAVDAEGSDPKACGYVDIAYVRGAAVETARSPEATFNIVEVLVVGVMTQSGLKATVPAVLFSVERVNERVA
jgi:hypothetical protein